MTKLSQNAVTSIKNMAKERTLQRRAGAIKSIMSEMNCSLDEACARFEQRLKNHLGTVPPDVQTDLAIIRQRSEAWLSSIGMVALTQ